MLCVVLSGVCGVDSRRSIRGVLFGYRRYLICVGVFGDV